MSAILYNKHVKNHLNILEDKMVFEKIRNIIAEQLDVDAEDIAESTSLTKDLEADSLDAVEIIMAIEEEFGIEIPDEEAEEFETVAHIVRYVEDNM